MATSSCDVAVLGAGPAGLAAALHAVRRGRSVQLFERREAPGGMAGSFEVAGVRVDHGSHRLHPSIDPDLLGELRDLLGEDLQVRERDGRIRLADRWVAFPLRTGDMLRNLPPSFALRAARDALTSPVRRARADTFAEVVRSRLGPAVASEFYAPYVEKLWGTPPEELSGELARRRVGAASPLDVIRRLLRSRDAGGRAFLYPRRGFGQIAEALAGAATDAGAELHLGAEVTGLDLGGEHTRVHLAGRSAGDSVDAGRVWSTLPVPLLARLAGPDVPEPAIEAGERLRHRALLLVYLVLPGPRYTRFDAHYFPGRDLAVARLSEPKNYRDDPEEPDDVTVVCAEVACWEGDERWHAEADELGGLVADDLRRAGLPAPEVLDVAVRRLPRVYPVYRPGFEDDLAALEDWVASQPRLTTFGRQGLFVPDNTHHALAMGRAAAEALRPDGSFDEERWARARDGFRSHVVED